ncbi:restriction endonuclease subunit S [Pantoea agglomerans]|uniref:restriction endonuclease subunit S n=1 Tax=Enterobacter agglomerans TaxID=549 RepID=UPI00289E3F99|nr:restriction endonuclease subunit S [Pantoea agglomerans]WNK43946.1 restriction endonuclease subunit S [Pantoea agglomerans]
MTKYKAYPEYKDSGVEWLKAIPEHWKLSKLRYQFVFGKGLTITKEHLQDDGIPCVNYGEVHSKYGFEVDPKIHILKCVSDKYLKDNSSSLLAKGDIVFADTSEDIDGSGNFTQLVSDIVTFAGYHTIIARPFERENSRFYAYLLDCKELRSQVRHAVKGVKVFSITQAILRNLSIWLPSKDEQAQIASFLDHETAKIDNLIEKQQQLIELLKEKRQAVISHAVTKGLNPDVPMKDSGVEWLGEVPAHWDSVRVKQVSSFITSGPRGWSDYITDDGDEIFLQSGDLNNELGLNLDKAKRVSPPKNAEGVRTRLMNGDVVICITGANTGRVAIVSKLSQKTYINQHLSLIRPETPKINSSFLGYCLTSSNGRSYFEVAQYGLKEGLNLSNIAEAPLALPPFHEQDAIVKYLKCVQNNYDYLSCLSANQVGLLQERRTALISAAVTGKIDVRDWVAPDTQDVEEPQEATA